MKLASVGGAGMNTGGKAVLSTSFLKDRDSIQRNTISAGEMSTATQA